MTKVAQITALKNMQALSQKTGDADGAALETSKAPDQWHLTISGDWTGPYIQNVDAAMRQLQTEHGSENLVCDLNTVTRLDTAGAWLLHRLRMAVEANGGTLQYVSDNSSRLNLLNAIAYKPQPFEKQANINPLVRVLEAIGRNVYTVRQDFLMGAHIVGASIRGAQLKTGKRGGIRIISIVHQIEVMGLHAVPIIALMSFLIGVIIAQQGAQQLKVFGAEILVIDLVGILHLREIGVLLTAIMVAGRTGSAITAELGAMKMREEIDALTVIGLNPVGVLIFPRIVALMIVLPLLTLVADLFGIVGAIMVSWAYVDIPPQLFINTLRIAIDLTTVFSGVIKAPFMAFIIAIIASIEGMKVSGSAESLGKHTTAAVVKSIFVVIVVDGLFAIFYGAIDF